jgi:hypothetical protein
MNFYPEMIIVCENTWRDFNVVMTKPHEITSYTLTAVSNQREIFKGTSSWSSNLDQVRLGF